MRTEAAKAAAAIRKELKAAFPGIKFSVRSSTYSMGDSVDVDYEDGPTSSSVTDITCKYKYGHFNGSEDIYEYSNQNDAIPQAKFVMVNRAPSDATYDAIRSDIMTRYGIAADATGRDWLRAINMYDREAIYRKFNGMELS